MGAIIVGDGRDIPRRVTYRAAVALSAFTVFTLWFKRNAYLHSIYKNGMGIYPYTATKPVGTAE